MATASVSRPENTAENQAQSVDLRSDTLTRPGRAMRAAMAAAEVGDDVFGEDPSVNRLEARCRELAGKAAALFVPSGTMANLIACRMHTVPGDEVLIERTSHLYRYEAGGFAAVAGVSVALLDGEGGQLAPQALSPAMRASDVHQPRSRLLWLENTHNFGGGTFYTLPQLEAVCAAGRALGLRIHMDGARVWNACAAAGYALSDVAGLVDSLSFCFSKGLGCPVGSVLVGDADFIAGARRVRKQLGGGMRQAGVLAAAASYALDHHVGRLPDDHGRAQALSDAIARVPGLRPERDAVPTNIVFVDASAHPNGAQAVVDAWAAGGLLALAVSPTRIRLVTHLDVDDLGLARALAVIGSTRGA